MKCCRQAGQGHCNQQFTAMTAGTRPSQSSYDQSRGLLWDVCLTWRRSVAFGHAACVNYAKMCDICMN